MQMKRHLERAIVAMAVVLTIGLASATASAGSGFSDVGPSHPFAEEIGYVADHGIAQGYDDGTFRPAQQVTRQAIATFLYRQAGSPPFTPPASADRSFVDVPVGHSFYAPIEWAAAEGLVNGWTTDYVDPETGPLPEYRPSVAITRQAVAALLHRAAGSPAFDPPGGPAFHDVLGGVAGPEHPFRTEIEWAHEEGLMNGWDPAGPGQICYDWGCSGWFRPKALTTRQGMAAVLARFDQRFPPDT